jgi:GR25 family glycosyltransferase involved in LPS biosynthesis
MVSSDINTFFDKIYYINLDRDVKRNESIISNFSKFGITNYIRVPGVLVDTIPEPYLYRNFIKKNERYIKGQLGCREAHLNIISDAKKNSYSRIAIFEDDIIFTINPSQLLAGNLYNIQEFDLLYFGGLQEQVFNNQIVTTHAMGISYRIFDDILYMAEPSGMEIDNFYAKIIQQMSKNTRQGGKCIVKKIEPFNSIQQSTKFTSNITNYQ